MIKLKIKLLCLYKLIVEQTKQMSYSNIFTKFVILFNLFFFLNLPTFSQIPQFYYPYENDKQINLIPYFLLDSCVYFPESIFTIGNYQIGTKFAQFDLKKNSKKNNGRYFEIKPENDTTTKGNRIISIREADKGDKMAIYIQVENMDKNISIVIYNLLGKKVLDVYEGRPKDPSQPYEFSTSELPKGIFLLVVIGENFRLREKLVITK